ncbi:MAG: hypothetical protein KGD73_03505 [Candidatus Lokiarchaeota archaeon]|nr:hypothetical protein [Candidatus Lokiarchaeota archaeon]
MNIVRNERNRYIIFKIINEGILAIHHSDILKSIWKSIWHFFGMKEATKIGLWLIEIDLENKFGIIRCAHQTKEIIITALSLVTEINGNKIILSPVKTSGTIKSIKEYISIEKN